jgi:hypothetical protein
MSILDLAIRLVREQVPAVPSVPLSQVSRTVPRGTAGQSLASVPTGHPLGDVPMGQLAPPANDEALFQEQLALLRAENARAYANPTPWARE